MLAGKKAIGGRAIGGGRSEMGQLALSKGPERMCTKPPFQVRGFSFYIINSCMS